MHTLTTWSMYTPSPTTLTSPGAPSIESVASVTVEGSHSTYWSVVSGSTIIGDSHPIGWWCQVRAGDHCYKGTMWEG